jgi:Ca-activated chloride channel family protein
MLDFTNPFFLLLLPLIPLVVWRWLRRPRARVRYPDFGVLAALSTCGARAPVWFGAGGRAVVLLLLVLALAGPRSPDPRTRIATEGISIEMIVDNSGSMAEPDFLWEERPISRLDAVKRVFQLFVAGGQGPRGQFLEGRPNDLIGLVTFATWPESPCPLTLDHEALLHVVNVLRPRKVPTEAHTNIGDALAWGLHRLASASTARKVIILLSDGEHNVPPPALTPRQAAQLAANQRIAIYAIEAAGEGEKIDSEVSPDSGRTAAQIRKSARESMQAIAKMTGGKYFRAADTEQLLAVCQEIDHLERSAIESFLYRNYYDWYPWLGLAALALYVAIQVAEATFWLRVP